jgi:hypothetical protein
MSKISERPQTTKTTKKEPVAGPPPPSPAAGDEDAVSIEQLSSTTKRDAFGGSGPRFARGDFALPVVRRPTDEGPDLVIDDEADHRLSLESNAVSGTMGAVPPPRSPSSTFKTVDEAVTALEHDFGAKVDRRSFSLEELSRVHESLALVPKKDRAALQGVEFVREHEAPAEVQEKRKDGGTVAGAFFDGTNLDHDGKRARGPHIAFYDTAFPSTKNNAEDRRLSQSVVLHEAAHAIDRRAAGDAKVEFALAQYARKEADAEATEKRGPFTRSLDAYRAVDQNEPKSRAFSDASEGWLKAHNALIVANDPIALARAQAGLAKATKARDAALARLPDGHVKEMAQNLAEKQDALAAPETRAAQARVAEEAAVKMLRPLVAVAKNADDNAVIAAETKTVVSFANAVTMQVTGYGGDGPDENFAEAYALYRRDPKLLEETNSPAFLYMKKHHP